MCKIEWIDKLATIFKLFAIEKPRDIAFIPSILTRLPGRPQVSSVNKVFLISRFTACRHNCLFKSRNGIGHLELGMWKTVIVFAFNAFPVKEDFNLRVFLFSWQLCHVAIWGSIASWFIFLLIYCIPDIALYIAPDMMGQVCLFSLPTWVHCMGHGWPISKNMIKWFYR